MSFDETVMNKAEELIQLIMQQNELMEKQTELLALLTGQVMAQCGCEEEPEGGCGTGCSCGC